jgi:sulfopyruvate decarboxylase subunit alpha
MLERPQTPTAELYKTLRASGLDFFLSVPCKLLANLIETFRRDPEIFYSPVTREEEGVGIACGAHLAGRRPAIAMQNSGFGNSANAILSLLNYYKVPIVFVVSHRGTEGEPIEAQRMMGNASRSLLDVVGVDHISVSSPEEVARVGAAIETSRAANRSLAILLPFSFWSADT